jgi:hypothetical protein
MSLHEFECLVEDSVNLLAPSGRPAAELRSMYWNVYEFEGHWDTSFTHFRNMDQLLAARFVYQFPVSEHPDYEVRKAYFDGIDRFWLVEGDDGEWDGGYIHPPHLYFDAGSRLWSRMVGLGRLTGDDTEPPQDMRISEVGLAVSLMAEAAGDVDLVARWYRLLCWEIAFADEPPALAADPALRQLRDVVRRTDALSVPMEGRILADPDEQTLAENPSVTWWFDLNA